MHFLLKTEHTNFSKYSVNDSLSGTTAQTHTFTVVDLFAIDCNALIFLHLSEFGKTKVKI